MADADQLFGSDSESDKNSAVVSTAASPQQSGSDSGSGSGSGSAPGSPAGSSSGSDSGSGSAPGSPAQGGSAPGSPAHGGSAPGSPTQGGSAPGSPAQGGSAPGSPAHSGSAPGSPSHSGSASGSPAHSGSASGSPKGRDSAPGSPASSSSASGSGSGSGSPSGSGSAPASPSGSGSAPASPAGSGSAPGSPAGSDSAPGSPAGSGSAPGSPAGVSSANSVPAPPGPDGSKQETAQSKSGSPASQRSATPPNKEAKESDSDSDVPTGRRQRLASDSGSDPDAVRATAEDIFGEADDISEDEQNRDEQEGEEKEEEVPETRIEVEIPRVVADLGESLSFAKLPNFLSVETRPFDPVTYEDEIDEDEVMDEEGRARLKLKVENTIRWRYVKDPQTGEAKLDEFGDKIRESNAKIVKWSDGSQSLHLGTEVFDVFSMPMQDHNHLYIRQGTGLQGQAMFKNKLSFRPHSTDSFTHRKMTMSLADRSTKSQKIKVLPIAGVDPEMSKTENLKKEEERLRASIRRENQQRRTRERAHARQNMSSSYLEGDEDISISAIKSKYKKSKDARREQYSSDSADEEYETDGEDDLRRSRLQKAKRLADSDDENAAQQDSDEGTTTLKKSRVMSGSESD